ncbi:uncharacterized protein CDV56_107344 [Aspergillus thermomutatus]|uniref:Transcription factor domain-containing protein n=1 Tax=Aspergillus thermomutatus TaxID=41047 RepID=A0A397HGL6_ASPTH|nr:uncharacterized protein CDV56_107344 [Aspergillus thermomutatus]RHZ60706.1 hypothetical protein CDV56_107344 [Aspergillus thermomutatus]
MEINDNSITELQLTASFISFFNKNSATKIRHHSWLTFHVLQASSPGRRACIRAASLALYAKHTGDTRAILESHECYGRSLQYQQERLASCSTSTAEDIAMTVILAYYEAILPSSPSASAFAQHITAATAMLCAVGAEKCQQGWLHQMLLTLRLHMVYVSFNTWTASVFASEEWMRIPFRRREKSPLDRIVDLLLQYPSTPTRGLVTVYGHTSTALKAIWRDMNQSTTDTDTFRDYIPPKTGYPDSQSAITIALYSFAWVFTLSAKHAQHINHLITAHCEAILAVAVYIDSIQDGCSLIRMAMPLLWVSRHSPEENQQEKACGYLQKWNMALPMDNLCLT